MSSLPEEATEPAGWYGKLVTLGDFAQRRLPAHWIQVCDAWLSASMHAGEKQLREHWVGAYLNAPILRFAWAPEVVDEFWWFGLLMPSCDNVGRYFPLMIAQARARPPENLPALDHLELWFDHLANAALRTLNESEGHVDAFEATLQQAPPWPTLGAGSAHSRSVESWGERRSNAPGLPLSRWVHSVMVEHWTRGLAGHSLWWHVDPCRRCDSIDIVRGLPDGSRFVALIQGTTTR